MPQSEALQKIISNMETVIVGKREVIEYALITLLSDGHLLLEDVPGVGKTTLGKALAQSIQCSFARIQFTPDTLPGDVTGMSIYQMQTGEFRFVPGVVMNDILLADEINRTSPKTQASLLEAMEERQITVDGRTNAPACALYGHRHAKSRGTAGNLPASRSTAGPLYDEGFHGIPGKGTGRGGYRAQGLKRRGRKAACPRNGKRRYY